MRDLCSKLSSPDEGKKTIRLYCTENARDESVLRTFLPCLYEDEESDKDLQDLPHRHSEEECNTSTHSFEDLCVVVYKLICTIGKVKKPIVIFLDEIQWADQPSLKLIKFLVDDNLEGLLILVSYRCLLGR
jgi:predicted ATPase